VGIQVGIANREVVGELLGIDVDNMEGPLVGIAEEAKVVAVVALFGFSIREFVDSLVHIAEGDDAGAFVEISVCNVVAGCTGWNCCR
jgi:hypothetical protein